MGGSDEWGAESVIQLTIQQEFAKLPFLSHDVNDENKVSILSIENAAGSDIQFPVDRVRQLRRDMTESGNCSIRSTVEKINFTRPDAASGLSRAMYSAISSS